MVLCNDGRKSIFQYLPFKPRTFSLVSPQSCREECVCGAGYWVYWFVFLGFIEIKKKTAADSSFMC